MRVLVVGGGGREHALALAIGRSPSVRAVYAAPGNPGIESVATCVPLDASDPDALARFAAQESIDLTVVGPEAPLVQGLADRFQQAGLRVFGPVAAAARLEGSKVFAKELCRKHSIPTGSFRVLDDPDAAMAAVETWREYPMVLKADGLAAGKGVVIAKTPEDAREAIQRLMIDREFGDAGSRILMEEFLAGTEASVLAVVDGRTLAILPPARDHKAALDGDRGPNTGGMGAVSPTRAVTPEVLAEVERSILIPVVHALGRRGSPFRGFLYAGLMLTRSGPRVLEFNVRMGDPEAQVILPRLRGDFAAVLVAAADGRLDDAPPLEVADRAACGVVLASGGYPGPYETGHEIHGIAEAEALEDTFVFHAGTARKGGRILTAGGRVLCITALGDDLAAARDRAYDAVARVRFQDAYYRADIGRAELEGR